MRPTGSTIAGCIQSEISRKHSKMGRFTSKYKKNDYRECDCLICGKHLDLLTHVHAEGHGYANKYELIEDGKIKWR